ncbi:MAG: STAS domain-containing protein [Armatimonadetes bacterium]|nr:STAS domain-containing protein [Armatimonadota bacterium]
MAEPWRVSKLEVTVRYEDDIPVIEARGECDLITSRKLKETADDLIRTVRNKIVFDLRDTSYIDSSGFRALLEARNKVVQKGGNIALVSLTAPVERVFSLLRLEQLIIRTDTIEEAVVKLKSAEPTQC